MGVQALQAHTRRRGCTAEIGNTRTVGVHRTNNLRGRDTTPTQVLRLTKPLGVVGEVVKRTTAPPPLQPTVHSTMSGGG